MNTNDMDLDLDFDNNLLKDAGKFGLELDLEKAQRLSESSKPPSRDGVHSSGKVLKIAESENESVVPALARQDEFDVVVLSETALLVTGRAGLLTMFVNWARDWARGERNWQFAWKLDKELSREQGYWISRMGRMKEMNSRRVVLFERRVATIKCVRFAIKIALYGYAGMQHSRRRLWIERWLANYEVARLDDVGDLGQGRGHIMASEF